MNQTPCLRIFILEPVLAAEVMSCALSPFPHLVKELLCVRGCAAACEQGRGMRDQEGAAVGQICVWG